MKYIELDETNKHGTACTLYFMKNKPIIVDMYKINIRNIKIA